MKYRNLLFAALGIVGLYIGIQLLAVGWRLLSALVQFLASVRSDHDAFTVVSFALAVLPAAAALPLYRELVDDGPWGLRSWSDFGALMKENRRWYGLAAAGGACGGLALYLFLTHETLVPLGFGLFACYCATVTGVACFGFLLFDIGRGLWLLARDGGWAVRS